MEIAHDEPGTAHAEHYQSCEKMARMQVSYSMLTCLQSFNTVTQHDSHVLKNDSKSMKAIASVTVAFLPLATVAVRDIFVPLSSGNTDRGNRQSLAPSSSTSIPNKEVSSSRTTFGSSGPCSALCASPSGSCITTCAISEVRNRRLWPNHLKPKRVSSPGNILLRRGV